MRTYGAHFDDLDVHRQERCNELAAVLIQEDTEELDRLSALAKVIAGARGG
jgi:hypothetical protein